MITSDHNLLTSKLGLRRKIVHGTGDVGSNLVLCTGTPYSLKFCIDELGMLAYYDGIIFLVAKPSDVFTDMLAGFLLDSQESIGPKGKFRPFILYAAVPAVLIATLQLIATTSRLSVKMTITIALFMMFELSYSLMSYSYDAMVPAATKNPNKRVQLVAHRQGGATIGLLICTVAFIPLQSLLFNSTVSYVCTTLMLSVDGFIFMMLYYRGVKEHYVDAMPVEHEAGILRSFRVMFRNPPLLILCTVNLCTLATFNIRLAAQVYYTQYMLNDINLLSWMGSLSMGCILVGVLLVPAAVKCSDKKQVYLTGMVLWAVGDILNYFWGSNSFIFIMFSYVALSDTAFVNDLNWTLVPDTVDYGGWKTGIRVEGSVYTGYTFFRKVSAALAGFLSGIILMQIGYVPNIVQNDVTLQGLCQLIFIWPCALAIITALTMGFLYTLNKRRLALIIEEIDQHKNEEVVTEEKTASVTL